MIVECSLYNPSKDFIPKEFLESYKDQWIIVNAGSTPPILFKRLVSDVNKADIDASWFEIEIDPKTVDIREHDWLSIDKYTLVIRRIVKL